MKLKIGFPINFKKARLPSKKKLNGKYCFLEPRNSKKHSKNLFKNFSFDKKGISYKKPQHIWWENWEMEWEN